MRACAISLHRYPNYSDYNGGVSGAVADWNNSSTCTGWLERSDNGGPPGTASPDGTPPGVGLPQTTGISSDDPSRLARVRVIFSGSGDSGTICTIGT